MKKLKNQTLKAYFRWLVNFLPKTNKSNIKVVVLCLIAATTFWFFNALNKKNYTTKISYPVTFDFNRDSLIALTPLPEQIIIEVTGGGWNVLRKSLNIDSKPVVFKLNNPEETRFITSENIIPKVQSKLGELQVNVIEPDTINLNIEPVRSIDVAVKVDSNSINLEEGYHLSSPVRVEPGVVTVSGPSSSIFEMSDEITLKLKENGIDDHYNDKIPIPISEKNLLSVKPSSVRVSFEVEKWVRQTREVNVEKTNFPPDSNLDIYPSSVKVTYRAPESVAKNDNILFQVIADYSRVGSGDNTITPEFDLIKDKVEIISFTPEQLKITHGHD